MSFCFPPRIGNPPNIYKHSLNLTFSEKKTGCKKKPTASLKHRKWCLGMPEHMTKTILTNMLSLSIYIKQFVPLVFDGAIILSFYCRPHKPFMFLHMCWPNQFAIGGRLPRLDFLTAALVCCIRRPCREAGGDRPAEVARHDRHRDGTTPDGCSVSNKMK